MRMPSRDAIVNGVIVLTCLVLAGIALERRFVGGAAKAAPMIAGLPAVGQSAQTYAQIAYRDAPLTFVLHLKSTCQYCTASMPFYKSLQEAIRKQPRVRLVVVAHESVEVARSYMRQHGLEVDRIHTVTTDLVGPTPLLIAVDQEGTVQKAWVGQQDARNESDVISLVGSASAS